VYARAVQVTVYGRDIRIYVGSVLILSFTDSSADYISRGTVGFYAWNDDSTTYDNLLVTSVTLWSDNTKIATSMARLGATSIGGVETGSWAMIGKVGAPPSKVPVVSDLDVRCTTTPLSLSLSLVSLLLLPLLLLSLLLLLLSLLLLLLLLSLLLLSLLLLSLLPLCPERHFAVLPSRRAVWLAQNGAVVATTLFNCAAQSRVIPENLLEFKVVPEPTNVFGASRPSGFYIADGNVQNAFGMSPNTGQIFVRNVTALNYELMSSYTLTVAARQRGFDSGLVLNRGLLPCSYPGACLCCRVLMPWVCVAVPVACSRCSWFKMGSQNGEASFKEVRHDMYISPASLTVSTLVRAVDGENKGYAFNGVGSVHNTDGTYEEYGGVLFGYDSARVRLWAPSRLSESSLGYMISIGYGWGATYSRGNFIGESGVQHSHVGEVRVVVRPDKAAVSCALNPTSLSVCVHVCARVVGRCSATRSGFVHTRVCTSVRSDRNSWRVVFVGRSLCCCVRPIVLPMLMRLLSSSSPPLQDFDSGWFLMAAQSGIASFETIPHGLGAYPAKVKVLVRAVDGNNQRYVFEGAGAAQTSDYYSASTSSLPSPLFVLCCCMCHHCVGV
jgi:hypothetical protein